MRYIIFTRVSTKMQETKDQIFECTNYINSIKKEDDKVLIFDEKTKTTRDEMEDRPVLLEMLNELKRGDNLVVYKLNRLARGHEMSMLYNIITKKKGAILTSLYEKEVDETLIHAYALVAASERKNIQQNTITALKRKQAEMEKVGTVWYGYKTDETKLQTRENVRSSGKPYKLIPNSDEQEQLAIMIKLRNQGHSYGEIVHELESKGHKNRKGNRIHKSTVMRVLRRINTQRQAPSLVASM